jgi:hypothetical protein
MESIIAKDRHDSWNNETFNACCSAFLHPLKENCIIIEELCNDEVSPCINFLLQILDIVSFASGGQVCLRIPCYSDREKVSILLPYKSYEVNCMVKTILNADPVLGSSGRISSQT